ncbi:MAG: DNA mismatch repair endonuclease MutL [Treponema sp.]|nr:DNA mismatch repair endonuclease MutL [Treponema sp.]
MQNNSIQVLPAQESKLIAAGEVIERPAALVREFLDNAIDAGAANIEVSITQGGCKKVEVSDDGAGMSHDDLQLCSLTHATSKIRSLNDLETSRTLGFRGEALAASSAVARLEIITSTDGRQAYRLEAGPGEKNPAKTEQTRRTKGTTVRALNLFENTPARKSFLKREGSEAVLCRQIFIEKALAFNTINFRYLQDDKLKDFLPAVETKKERFAAALLKPGEENFLFELNVIGEGFTAVIIIGGPELYRNDRRQLFVFANGRKVHDYSLLQAMEYGCQGWFPNGTHPVGAVFVEIDPALADFNVHPAKREVRFRDPGAIHHVVSGGVKSFFHKKEVARISAETSRENIEIQKDLTEEISHGGTEETQRNFSRRDAEKRWGEFSRKGAKAQKEEEGEFYFPYNNPGIKKNIESFMSISNNNSAPLRLCESSSSKNSEDMHYAGRVFGLFILIEWGDKLYIIDQHAAHERILYNKFLENPIPKQELLAPIPFNTDSEEEDKFLKLKSKELSQLGIVIKKDESDSSGVWHIEALPADWRKSDSATVKEILELRNAGENMANRWAASLCCSAAIKDGDYPDDETAFELGRQALTLSDPRCPHGRPIWTEISKEALYKAVRRI